MLHFEGDTDFAQPPSVVAAKLGDVHFLAECIPDREQVSFPEPDTMVCVVRPGLSFIRGTLEVTLRRTALVDDKTLRFQGHGKGIGSSNDLEVQLDLAPQDEGTRVHWAADVTHLGGLLKMLPKGLLQAAAQKVIEDVWASVKKKMSG